MFIFIFGWFLFVVTNVVVYFLYFVCFVVVYFLICFLLLLLCSCLLFSYLVCLCDHCVLDEDEEEVERGGKSDGGAGVGRRSAGQDATKGACGGGGEVKSRGGEQEGKKKRHRVHRKQHLALAFKDLDLRVMAK